MAQGDTTVQQLDGQIYMIKKSNKPDTKAVITTDVLLLEDEFQSLYFTPNKNTNVVIEPPFNPLQLASLVHRNNVLPQCVTAMEVNIDGSGYVFELLDAEKDKVTGDFGKADADTGVRVNLEPSPVRKDADSEGRATLDDSTSPPDEGGESKAAIIDPELEMLEHFFKEPFPGVSFTTIRRKIRIDMESTGNGYMEVIRNLAGEVIFLRHLESVSMRLVKLDSPTNVEVTVTRKGESIKAALPMRERRYAYKIGAHLTYYREFGASRQVNKKNGSWIANDSPDNKNPDILGSEVLHFIVYKDFRTHYGMPRWINQLPSVLGSRKAEEFNLEFFDAGGLPPALIFVEGGVLMKGVKEQLDNYLSGKASTKHRAAVVEVVSTSGSMDSASKVSVKVERFGGNQSDAMFSSYDASCSEHIRKSFRLPKLLIGDSDTQNRAVAQAALQAAENQVFQPERFHFDEIINNTVVKALGAKRYRFRSLNMTLADSELQLSALKASWNLIDGESYINTINELSGLTLKYSAEAEKAHNPQQPPPDGSMMPQPPLQDGVDGSGDGGAGGDNNTPPDDSAYSGQDDSQTTNLGTPKQPIGMQGDPNAGMELGQPPYIGAAYKVEKSERLSPSNLLGLVTDWAVVVGLTTGTVLKSESEVLRAVDSLKGADRDFFDQLLLKKVFKDSDKDIVAMVSSCTAEH